MMTPKLYRAVRDVADSTDAFLEAVKVLASTKAFRWLTRRRRQRAVTSRGRELEGHLKTLRRCLREATGAPTVQSCEDHENIELKSGPFCPACLHSSGVKDGSRAEAYAQIVREAMRGKTTEGAEDSLPPGSNSPTPNGQRGDPSEPPRAPGTERSAEGTEVAAPSSPHGGREDWSAEDYERGRRYYELSHRRDWSKNPASIKGNYIRAAKALWDEARSRVAQDEVRGRVCLAVAGAAHDAGLYPFKTTGEKDLFDACHGACIAAFDSLGIPAPAPGTLQMEAHYDPAPSLPSRDKVKAALCDATEDAHTDNLAVVLASYYEKSIHRPKPDPIDQELGWSRWCMEQSDAALDRLIDAVIALRGEAPDA